MCTDAARKYISKNDCGRISSGVTRGYICPVCFLKHSLQLIQIFFGRFEEGVIRVTFQQIGYESILIGRMFSRITR